VRRVRHAEGHFTSGEMVRDVVLGMADGLTVPFALAAGLSGAVESTTIIVVAGVAEIAAGAVAMGLGGYLAAKSEAEHYVTERQREAREVGEIPAEEAREIADIFSTYGVTPDQSAPVIESLKKRPEAWVDFMMRFELGLEKPQPRRARVSAVTIGLAYVAGGLIPLAPYMIIESAAAALRISVVVTLAALAIFGYVKGRFTGTRPLRSALQTMLIGGLAAAAAFAIARALT